MQPCALGLKYKVDLPFSKFDAPKGLWKHNWARIRLIYIKSPRTLREKSRLAPPFKVRWIVTCNIAPAGEGVGWS